VSWENQFAKFPDFSKQMLVMMYWLCLECYSRLCIACRVCLLWSCFLP